MKVSGSTIQSWQRCRRAAYFRDGEWGLGYTTAADNQPIRLGNWMHYGLGLVLRGFSYEQAVERTLVHQHELWDRFFVEPPDDYSLQVILFTNLMLAHRGWQESDTTQYSDSNLEILSTEQRWELEYLQHQITGQMDAIVRLKDTGEVFVLERKVTKHPESMLESAQWDIQPRLYVWAAQQMFPNEQVCGVIYEFIRNTDPTKVKLLKNGYPSRAKQELMGTTPEVYRNLIIKAAERAGDSPDRALWEYAEAMEELIRLGNPVFRRQTMWVPKEHQRMAIDLAWRVGNEIQDHAYYSPDRYIPSLSRYQCNSPFSPCAYRDVCLAFDDGADWLEMLDLSFVTGKPHFDEGINDEGFTEDE